MRSRVGCLFLAFVALGSVPQVFGTSIMDSVNADKSPSAHYSYGWNILDAGWLYTPGVSYQLTGINTKFGRWYDGRVITVEFYDGDPLHSSTSLLRSASFAVTSNTFSGGSFAPVAVTAGQTYFVGFRGINDDAQHAMDVNFTEDDTAVSLSQLRITWTGCGGCAGSPLYGYTNAGSVPTDPPGPAWTLTEPGSRPILQFVGSSVPEPTSLLLLGTGVGVIGMAVWRRRK